MELCFTQTGFRISLAVFMLQLICFRHVSAFTSRFNLSDEATLIRQLLHKYRDIGRVARPLRNSSLPLQIQFKLRLINMDIDEKHQSMKTSVWVICRWTDEHLQWDPEEFGGLKQITVPWDHIWMPDIALVNTRAETLLNERTADIEVSYKGRVYWTQHRIYSSACLIDVTNYPYDEHTCDMWFQSLSQYSWHMDLQLWPKTSLDLDTYLQSFKRSQEWEILRNTSDRVAKSQDVGVQLMYSRRVSLRFSLTLKRKPGFKCYILMFPCLLLSMLTIVIFCLPPDRVDRHMLGMSLFTSFTILLLMLIDIAPPSAASVPKLAIYYGINLIVITSAVFFSAMAVNISRRGETRQPPPSWLQKLIKDYLAKVLCLTSRVELLQLQQNGNCARIQQENIPLSNSIPTENSENKELFHSLLVSIDTKIYSLQKQISYVQDESPSGYSRFVKMQWRLVSTVVDRMCFILFFILNITLVISLYPKP